MARARRRRNRLSMTSLIDVIFLLLLFFMLSSTFAKFSEIELSAATTGQGAAPGAKPLFLQLGVDALTLNGSPVTLDALATSALAEAPPDTPLLVALRGPVTSQRLADLLVALRSLSGLRVTVLEG